MKTEREQRGVGQSHSNGNNQNYSYRESTQGSTNKLLQYLPEFYHDILDFVELTDAQDAERISAEQAINQLFDNQFVMSSDERAVRRRERMLGIQANPSRESLDFRKKRIVNRYSTKPPFTIHWLQEQLDRLVGPGLTIVSVDVQNFILTVTANIDNAAVFREVVYTIDTIKPANLAYQQNTSLEERIGLEEHISKREMFWKYKLDGTWQLGEKPFLIFGPEVAVL